MKKLLILSDMWGSVEDKYLSFYIASLQQHYTIEALASPSLAAIDPAGLTAAELHNRFMHGGIETAVENLLQKKEYHIVLGFSIGGYIAWQAANKGMPLDRLVAVSSTRLRFETKHPTCETTLFYGEQDPYRPSDDWLKSHSLTQHLIANEGHELYQKQSLALVICNNIIS